MRSVIRSTQPRLPARSRSSRAATRDCRPRRPSSARVPTSSTTSPNTSEADGRHRFAARRHADQPRRLGARQRSAARRQGASRRRACPALPQKGSVDLGTFTHVAALQDQSRFPRPARSAPGLRDTTIRRYLQPINPRRHDARQSDRRRHRDGQRRRRRHGDAASSTSWPAPR